MMLTYDDPFPDFNKGIMVVQGTPNKVILFPDKELGFYVYGKPLPIFFEVSEPGVEYIALEDVPADQEEICNMIIPATKKVIETFIEKGMSDEVIANMLKMDHLTVACLREKRAKKREIKKGKGADAE